MNNSNKSNKYIMCVSIIIGLILLIINVILDMGVSTLDIVKNTPVLHWITAIVSMICASVGLALIVGFIINEIKISEIISSYAELNKKQKDQIIDSLITSNTSNELKAYKKSVLKGTLEYDSKYRSNVVYDAKVFVKNNTVFAETVMSYIEYRNPTNNEFFTEIKTAFDSESSNVEYYKISNPENVNESVTIYPDKIRKRNTKAHGDSLIYEQYCRVPEKFKKLPSISVEKKYTFIGQDHWISYAVMFARPLTKLNFSLYIDNNLSIKEVTIIGNENLYSKTQNIDNIKISSNKWLSNHNGFLIIISK